MLVLKRHVHETVGIGENVTVMVTAIGDGWVKLGFTAPPGVEITRPDMKYKQPKERDVVVCDPCTGSGSYLADIAKQIIGNPPYEREATMCSGQEYSAAVNPEVLVIATRLESMAAELRAGTNPSDVFAQLLTQREVTLMEAACDVLEAWYSVGISVKEMKPLKQALAAYASPMASADSQAGDLAQAEVARPEGTTPTVGEQAIIDGETA